MPLLTSGRPYENLKPRQGDKVWSFSTKGLLRLLLYLEKQNVVAEDSESQIFFPGLSVSEFLDFPFNLAIREFLRLEISRQNPNKISCMSPYLQGWWESDMPLGWSEQGNWFLPHAVTSGSDRRWMRGCTCLSVYLARFSCFFSWAILNILFRMFAKL